MQTLGRPFDLTLHSIFLFSCGPMEKLIDHPWYAVINRVVFKLLKTFSFSFPLHLFSITRRFLYRKIYKNNANLTLIYTCTDAICTIDRGGDWSSKMKDETQMKEALKRRIRNRVFVRGVEPLVTKPHRTQARKKIT